MALNINSYLFRRVLRISAFNTDTDELYGSLTRFSNVTFSNTQEEADVLSNGNIIARLNYGKQASMTMDVPVISDFLLALTSGTTVKELENTSDIMYSDTITINNNVGTLTHKPNAAAVAGDEIGYAYIVDNQGAPIKTFTQGDAVGENVFTYSAATNEITFNAGEVPNGSSVLLNYYPTLSIAKVIVNDSNSFSITARVEVDIAVSDVCNPSQQGLMRIVFASAQFGGSYDWQVSGTDPTTMSITIQSLLPCGTSELWRAYIYSEDDILTEVNP